MSSEDKKAEANNILSSCLSENNRELSKIMSKNTETIEIQLLQISAAILAISSEVMDLKELFEASNAKAEASNAKAEANAQSIEARLTMLQAVVDSNMEAINGDISVLPSAKGNTKVVASTKAKKVVKKIESDVVINDNVVVGDNVVVDEIESNVVKKTRAPAKKSAEPSQVVKKSNFLKANIIEKSFIEKMLNSDIIDVFTKSFLTHAKINISEIELIADKVDVVFNFTTKNDFATLQKSLYVNKKFKDFIEEEYNLFVSSQLIINDTGCLEYDN
jgi:hypothetical protein